MKKLARIYIVLGLLLAVIPVIYAQDNQTVFAGHRWAWNYAYGINPVVPPLQVVSGSAASGTYTISLSSGQIVLSDGSPISPLSITAPITIGAGASQETVTPTAVSAACGQPNQQQGACTVTATFAQAHGMGDTVRSGTFGLQEAINASAIAPSLGGFVDIDSPWYRLGGTQAIVQAAIPYANVYIEDNSGVPGLRFFTPTATTQTTSVAAAAPVLTTTGTGTLTSGAYFVKIAYVDLQGQISQPSTESTQTGTVTNISVAAPVAAAGQVGYIVYVTAAGGSTNTETSYPLLATNCTLTTLESVIPACSLANTTYGQSSSNALLTTNPATTTFKPMDAVATINRTAFAYYPASQVGSVGPTPAVVISQAGTATAAATYNIASLSFPGALFAQVGREYKICGSGHFTYATTGTTIVLALFEGPYNNSDVALATTTASTSTATSGGAVVQFCFNVDITAVSTTATAVAHGSVILNQAALGAGVPVQVYSDANVAAIASLPVAGTQQLRLALTNGAAFAAGGFVLDTLSFVPVH